MGTLELMVSPVVVDWWCVSPCLPGPLLRPCSRADLHPCTSVAPGPSPRHPRRRREHGRRWGPSIAGAFFGAGWWFFVDSVAVSSSHIPFSQASRRAGRVGGLCRECEGAGWLRLAA